MLGSGKKSIRGAAVSSIPSLHHEHSSYKWWVLANVMIGTFMAVLDSTIVDVSLAKIMATFGIGIDTVKWVATAYLLVFAVMLPTSGWVADHFGYKRTYTMGLSLFTLGSLLCSLSWNETALILFRVIQGAGAGFIMPVGMAIVTREFPPEKRGVALGFWAIAAAASVSLGPTLGGYLIDNFAWHSIFDINVPVGIVGIFATLVIQREYKTSKIRAFDIAGFISVSTFLTALLIALSDGNAQWNTGGWTSPFIVSCFALAAIGFAMFLIVELNVHHPLIDLSLLKNFNFGMANLVLFIFGMGMFGSTFLLPLYLQNGLGYTAFQAGSLFLPIGILMAIMAPIAGALSDRVNPKIPAIIGILLLGSSLFVNRYLSLFSETSSIMVSLYLRGLGMGLMFTPLSTIALSEIPRERMAQASGLFNVLRQIGGSFGVAIMGTLLTERTIFHTTMYGEAVNKYSPVAHNVMLGLQRFSQQAVGGTMALSSMRAEALVVYNLSQQAFVSAVDDDFFVAALITFLCIVPILFLRYKRKKGPGEKIVAME
ncbi:MAG: DHA2 family efflux MFS transporter permease subunit [Bacteroidetes bacterium]|nr:DHA2 family efflux MFS transporter permease subunit [Bacteroidota bacterium]MCL5737052.1 DHA2 family efflux MFS transporter permease subunit [Bacteroidota bacterium]